MLSIKKFLQSPREFPALAGLAAGLFPLGHYYKSNFLQVNSWTQFIYSLLVFIVFPTILFILLYELSKRLTLTRGYKKEILSILNTVWSGLLITFIVVGLNLKILALAGVALLVIGFFLANHHKKIIVLQLIVALVTILSFLPKLNAYLNASSDWMQQPDDIESIEFSIKPNIYMIQMDGYGNFDELEKPPYDIDISDIREDFEQWGFINYSNYRSNYYSTLTSNSSMFSMKHHYYYANPNSDYLDLNDSRAAIISDNPVLRILKNNGYTTSYITESPYLMVNRPKIGFDYMNIAYSEMPYLSRGFEVKKEVATDTYRAIEGSDNKPQFYLIQRFEPSHITNGRTGKSEAESERRSYIQQLEIANSWLRQFIPKIIELDPNALIVIHADHGGYVGLNSTRESGEIQSDEAIIKSMFTSILSIRWPNKINHDDFAVKSSVNLYRTLFAVLANDTKYLRHLQPDASYMTIHKGADPGVYKYIADDGAMVFEKYLKDLNN